MNIISNLEPKNVFKYFEEISKIPRESGNEKGISDYLVNFAKSRGLEVIQDDMLNVIIKKPGTKGYEASPTVIIQGHMDMVCEKNSDVIHDFKKDPLKLRVEEDYIYASGTTLGGDDGIAIAYGLALLDSKNINHPPIEFVATADEEMDMRGIVALDAKNLTGQILLNLDSEEEGKLLVSSAGGVRVKISLKIKWEKSDDKSIPIKISISGLKGGHSGMEIHKQRANSDKLLGRILNDLLSNIDYKIVKINGGDRDNAIPREGEVILSIDKNDFQLCKNIIDKWKKTFYNEFKEIDSNIDINLNKERFKIEKVFSKDTTKKAIQALLLIPSGVNTMSSDIEGLVESSTNLGMVKTTDSEVEYISAIRSSIDSLKEDIACRLKVISQLINADYSESSEYPGWQYDKDSKLRVLCEKIYEDITGEKPEILALHAGLECGFFKEKFKDRYIDIISFGPDIYDVHTPDEHISISSVKNQWEYLIKILENIK
ncbi:aminoacyl-histidine dipeptidase [Clostridium fallax]|uniref:Cytosol non-specific dipeptidase n=1 Tax=Clostridium fallax TaxID=1533 RepID=A0A1M4VBG1_9CLOT|nr:aminoacyl-histidine dipeptidase [Clostridium fallax]SHE66331.1 dipeptidase D [Clostridium fallax]SQB05797.1 aminoacyl-histidine dipeptidase [Clostridium fallax]